MREAGRDSGLLGLAREARRQVRDLWDRHRLKRLVTSQPLRLVIGASGIHDEGWIPTDIGCLDLLNPNHWEACLRKGSVDAMLAEHVWEHLSPDEGLAAARRCHEYLKTGGYLRVAVPDGFFPDEKYIEDVRAGVDEHKVLYTHVTLADLFRRAGFTVELLEYHEADGSFHYVDWSSESGRIHRSRRFDARNRDGVLRYTSLILDAHKTPRRPDGQPE